MQLSDLSLNLRIQIKEGFKIRYNRIHIRNRLEPVTTRPRSFLLPPIYPH